MYFFFREAAVEFINCGKVSGSFRMHQKAVSYSDPSCNPRPLSALFCAPHSMSAMKRMRSTPPPHTLPLLPLLLTYNNSIMAEHGDKWRSFWRLPRSRSGEGV